MRRDLRCASTGRLSPGCPMLHDTALNLFRSEKMKYNLFLSSLLYFLPTFLFAQEVTPQPDPIDSALLFSKSPTTVWQQGVRYQIDATLDTTKQALDASMFISYMNNSPDTLKRIYLQVPANAFTDDENTAVRELQRFQSQDVRIRLRGHPPLTIEGLQFHSIGGATDFPLRAYKFGDTILDWPLPLPLLPGDSLTMRIVFTVDLKEVFKRTKPPERQVDFVLWFPRLCVYDQRGWHPEPFHLMMTSQSVFTNFADFDVTLAVPANYVVASSGDLIEGDAGWDNMTIDASIDSLRFFEWQDSLRKNVRQEPARKLRFHALHAQNFIWSASPAFARIRNDKLAIDFFFRDYGGTRWAKKIVQEFDRVQNYFRDQIGLLPSSHLTFVRAGGRRRTVQPPAAFFNDDDPFDLAFLVAQMYVPGTVGINGIEEGWMSYGLPVYYAKAYSEARFGEMGYDADAARKDMGVLGKLYSLPSFDEAARNLMQLYMNSSRNEAMAKAVHEYSDPMSMLSNSFLKSAIVFEMLHFVIGDSAFKETLRDFYRSNRFRHANAEAFIAASEKNSGRQLDWFFDQWLHRTPTVDYKKGEIKKAQLANGTWRTEVNLERKGDGIMPVDVEIDLDNGEKMTKRWDGQAESGVVVFETTQKPDAVNIDPRNRILDNNPLNNRRPRLAFKPDLPFMQFLHMPSDAFVVLWRPTVGFNDVDGLRLGMRTRSSYRAFYHNLTLQIDYAFKSHALDGKIAYGHPLRRNNLLNRYGFLIRTNEGRFEADAHLVRRRTGGILSAIGSRVQVGVNYSGLRKAEYAFRKVESDTGVVVHDEWDEVNIFSAYVEASGQLGGRRHEASAMLRLESALPPGDRQFTKLSGSMELSYRLAGLTWRGRAHVATAFGPDELPLQDKFHGEGADARTRFRNDMVKTIGDAFSRQYIDGGGFLRGYAGAPLLAEQYASFNIEFGPSASVVGFSLFGFYDRGALWAGRSGDSFMRSDAGVAIAFGGAQSRFLGGSVLSAFSARFYVPFYVSHPLPGEKKKQFRYYFTIGRSL